MTLGSPRMKKILKRGGVALQNRYADTSKEKGYGLQTFSFPFVARRHQHGCTSTEPYHQSLPMR